MDPMSQMEFLIFETNFWATSLETMIYCTVLVLTLCQEHAKCLCLITGTRTWFHKLAESPRKTPATEINGGRVCHPVDPQWIRQMHKLRDLFLLGMPGVMWDDNKRPLEIHLPGN